MAEREREVARNGWDVAAISALTVIAAVMAITFRDYGATIDERHSATNGKYFLDWYASGFRDRAIIDDGNQRLYGSFFNAISAFVAKHSPLGLYDTGHALIAIASLVGLFFAYRTGRKVAGPMAGFFSLVLLAITPSYYGHSFINPKDIPFAVTFLVSLYYIIAFYDFVGTPAWKPLLAVGVAIGLTLGIRVGGIILFGYFVVLIALRIVARLRANSGGFIVLSDVLRLIRQCLVVGLIAWVVMLIWWPYGQVSPILNPLRALKANANFTDYGATTLYRGAFVRSDSLPLSYLPTWFAITLPEFYALILSVTGVALFAKRNRPARVRRDYERQSKVLFLIFATAFPLVMYFVAHPILYDGNRHFLFVIPPLAVLTGISLAWLMNNLSRPLKLAVGVVVSVLAMLTVYDMAKLHPYQYAYFNRSFGGLAHALGRFETDYWGVSHKEGVDWLLANYKVGAPGGSIRVANTAGDFQTAYYLQRDQTNGARFTPVGQHDNPDVILSITRYNAHLRNPGRVLHVVKRMNVPLLYVVELNQR
ncbi:MAG TPA: glycosyltransferase family 39 protein [Gemmatimonadaceae bacterium]|nr:glycosyltransferase family 39 protein [Gemmatimonadaceae bacterium]